MGWLFGHPTGLVPQAEALTGSKHPVLPDPKPHAVLGTPLSGPWLPDQEVAYFGLGCFWGAEKMFWLIDGVASTSVGYAGGVTENPTYREVCTGRTNHTEVVSVVYDPRRVGFEKLLVTALEAHDPTQGFRQGNDVGTQYRSAVFTTTDAQLATARRIIAAYAPRLREAGFGDITTEVCPLSETPAGTFYLAEDEHQQYLHKHPHGYCPHHSTGVPCS